MARRGFLLVAASAAGAVLAPDARAGESGDAMGVARYRQQCAGAQQMLRLAREFAVTLRRLRGAPFEQTFLPEMISHHQATTAMIGLELERGQRVPLPPMAQIIDRQTDEIAVMTRWLRDWYRVSPEQAMANAPTQGRVQVVHMERQSQLMTAALAAMPSGAASDEVFAQMMISRHLSAVLQAQTVPPRAAHNDLVELARTTVPTHLQEVSRMADWLHAWFHTEPCVST
jgi:uncharacterized protein (DUF305 family)